MNHEDRHARELDSAETFGESVRGELEDSERDGSWKASKAWRKQDYVQLGSHHRLKSCHREKQRLKRNLTEEEKRATGFQDMSGRRRCAVLH